MITWLLRQNDVSEPLSEIDDKFIIMSCNSYVVSTCFVMLTSDITKFMEP